MFSIGLIVFTNKTYFLLFLAVLNGANALTCYSCALCTEPFSTGATTSQITCNAGESCYVSGPNLLLNKLYFTILIVD